MPASRPVIHHTTAPARAHDACSSPTCSTMAGRCGQRLQRSTRAAAPPGGTARRGARAAVVILAPDRLVRNAAPPWLLLEVCEQVNTPECSLPHPFGDRPPGPRLTPRQGMRAEDARAPSAERTRRGRWEKARPGAFIPGASCGYGDRARPHRHGCAPQGMVAPVAAAVVPTSVRAWVGAHRSGRPLTKRLHAAHARTPTGKPRVWPPATRRILLTQRVQAGQARSHERPPGMPPDRPRAVPPRRSLQIGRDAPAMMPVEVFDHAPRPRQRPAAAARTRVPADGTAVVAADARHLGRGGAGEGLAPALAPLHTSPLPRRRVPRACAGACRPRDAVRRHARAERREAVVGPARYQWRRQPHVIPPRPHAWAAAQPPPLSALEAHRAPRRQRPPRLARHAQGGREADQAAGLTRRARPLRRQPLAAAWPQMAQDRRP